MKFSDAFMAILKKLGFVDAAKSNTLTAENWSKINEEFKSEHGMTLADAVKKQLDDDKAAAANAQALQIVTNALNTDAGNGDAAGSEGGESGANATTQAPEDIIAAVTELTTINKQQKAAMDKMANDIATLSTNVLPDNTTAVKPTLNHTWAHTDKFAFGIDAPMFSMDHRWNRIAANPSFGIANPLTLADSRKAEEMLRNAVSEFGASLAERYSFLQKNNLLNPAKLAAGIADFSGLSNANLGNQYVVFRQDQLIARFATMQQDIYAIFPRRFGVQDREVMTNAFVGDLSAAAQLGRVFKGDVKFEPEIGYVDDSMFKTIFDSLQSMERMYIGYLNTDGSDPVKWGMIEWILLQMGTKLIDEQKRRVIAGIYVKPETAKPGHFLNAGTGFIYTLVRYIHENKLLPMSDSSYASYDDTGSTMVDAVKAFVADVKEKVEGIDGKVIYLNKQHRAWWKNGLRAKYGKDTDFTGTNGDFVPDEELTIVWLAGMGQLPLMVIAKPGDFQPVENQPGEMFSLAFQQDMESVIVYSNWKEGFSGTFVGRQFANRAALIANDYAWQEVFINYPVVTVPADTTTVAASGKSFIFKTSSNTAATKLTDITGAKQGVAYVIEIGGVGNITKIDKAGRFAKITENFVPTAVGDYLMVVIDADNTSFRELERCVGGVRSINTETQPNVPGGRK